jgi:hypothetical protein
MKKTRRGENDGAHLIANRLVLEPWLFQDHLQLSVVKVGHPDGLGQSCILTLFHGLGENVGKNNLHNGLDINLIAIVKRNVT